jgi:TRAP-type mannitol/chloroaromatic compound transport system substrate-binding protein
LADAYIANEYYWQDRSPAFSFFTTVPFGLTAVEMYAWIYWGGGQELWDKVSANFNLKPFPSDVGEVQMGGWYNKEMTSIESFKGLRIRMPGLGGELMRRLGAIVINLPAGEIVPVLTSGALDAAEWVGPDLDLRLGLQTAARYYYYPGIHEPENVQSFAVNKGVWDSLSSDEQKLIETTLAGGPIYGLNRRHVEQMKVLPVLLEEHGVELRKFDDEILQTFGKISGEVVAEVGAKDPLTRRVYESYMKFRTASCRWTDVSQRAYLNARELDFPYGN